MSFVMKNIKILSNLILKEDRNNNFFNWMLILKKIENQQ